MPSPLSRPVLRRMRTHWSHRHSEDYFYCPLLTAALAARDDASFLLIAREAVSAGVDARTVSEIILQSHLFLGYPAMIEGMRLFTESAGLRSGSDGLPCAYDAEQCRRWHAEGMKKIRKLYGGQFTRLVEHINAFSPQVLTWMINDGYGRVLSRPGASFQLRELATVATLTVTGYTNQLGAHVRGTLNLGLAPSLVVDTISNCRRFCSVKEITHARKILRWAMTK